MRVLVVLVAAALAVQATGCCRCCHCFSNCNSQRPPQELPRDDRIPPTALRPEGAPAALPKASTDPRPTGAYGGVP
ncbi:MAG TPA: hypothetical protein VGE74_03740 [Gemmata sp.]